MLQSEWGAIMDATGTSIDVTQCKVSALLLQPFREGGAPPAGVWGSSMHALGDMASLMLLEREAAVQALARLLSSAHLCRHQVRWGT